MSARNIGKANRKEIRMLNENELTDYKNALVEFRKLDDYDKLVDYHLYTKYHNGPAFLPWHREFTKRFECVALFNLHMLRANF